MRHFRFVPVFTTLLLISLGCSSPPAQPITVSCCPGGECAPTAASHAPLVLVATTDPAFGSLVYILKSDPPEEAELVCYRNTGKGDLELVSARRITWDLKAWNVGGKGLSPEKLKKEMERAEESRQGKSREAKEKEEPQETK